MEIPRLMLVSSRERCRLDLVRAVAAALAGGVDVVQLREPDLPRADRRELALRLLDMTGPNRLVINRDLDLATELGVGVHLPEKEIATATVRAIIAPNRLIGRSVHSPAQGDCDDRFRADYVVAGHVYPTASHPGQPPLGVSGLAAIVRSSPVPVLAIGGITSQNAGEVITAGAAGVAVIGAILERDDPERAAREIRDALDTAIEAFNAKEMSDD